MRPQTITSQPIRLIKHGAVPDCSSFEVRFADGRPSRDLPSRRLRLEVLTREVALDAGSRGTLWGRLVDEVLPEMRQQPVGLRDTS